MYYIIYIIIYIIIINYSFKVGIYISSYRKANSRIIKEYLAYRSHEPNFSSKLQKEKLMLYKNACS